MDPERRERYMAKARERYFKRVDTVGREQWNAQQRERYAKRSDEQRIKDKLVAASYAGAKRRAKRAGVSEHVLPSELLKLYNDAFGLCAYCTLPHGDKAAIDHIIPLDQGGSNTIDNLAVTCALCNAMKSRRTPEQWLGPDWEIRRAAMLCNIQPYNYTLEVPQ